MAIDVSSITDATRRGVAASVAADATAACVLAAKAMSDWDTRTRAVFTKWFGAAKGPQDRGMVPTVISKMSFTISQCSFTLEDAGATLGANTNAEATHYTTIQSLNTLSTMGGTPVTMKLTDRFFNVLKRIQSNDQTQLETFIHELSHIAGATKDQDKVAPAVACYGRAAASALAVSAPDRARDNAENYGFFIVEIAGQTPTHSTMNTAGKWVVKLPPKVKV